MLLLSPKALLHMTKQSEMGYWHQRADERHGNSPPMQPGAICGQRQSWKSPDEIGVSKSMECDIFPSVLWHCWLGNRKGIQPVKQLGVGLLVVMIWLELCTAYSSSCHHHFHHRLLQWTPANPGSPGKWPLKRRERESNLKLAATDYITQPLCCSLNR